MKFFKTHFLSGEKREITKEEALLEVGWQLMEVLSDRGTVSKGVYLYYCDK